MSNQSKQEQIARAVELLQAGRLVAFPTETVYGLGADADNPAAVSRIFIAKGRPADHPLIVHLASAEQLTLWARDIPEIAWKLAEQFWPGPMTLILKRSTRVLDSVTGKQDTVGLRVPAHPIAQHLLKQFGGGIAAPSANKFGHISPTQAEHVQQELGNAVDLIIEGGPSAIGLESAIIDISGSMPRILRPGAILPSQLQPFFQHTISENKAIAAADIPRVSGRLLSHYAPVTPLKLISGIELPILIEALLLADKKFSVLSHSLPVKKAAQLFWFPMPEDAKNYACKLYATLRAADLKSGEIILVEKTPDTEEWSAINDRLSKASYL